MPLLILGAVVFLYLIWGSLHDISRADEGNYTFEYAALAISVPALFAICRKALQLSTPRGRVVWLSVATAILFLFDLSALSAMTNPKFDNDFVVGKAFLIAGVPLLAYLAFRLIRSLNYRRQST